MRDYEPDEHGVWLPHGSPVVPFDYSDGAEVEARMLENLRSLKDLSVLSQELREFNVDWVTRYHFSPLRANLLRPLAFGPGNSVLELGCGCGAITRYLGEAGCDVVAVEGSYARACVAAERVRDLPNCRIVCGDFQSLAIDQEFDRVVMVGVLEYAAVYDASDNPFHRLLSAAREQLTPNGVLVLAIENRFGLKYLAGAPEDHTSIPYFGVNDHYTDSSVRTFTQQELDPLLHASGFNKLEYLTPLPDYKFVRSVVRASAVPTVAWDTVGQLIATSFCEDAQIATVPPFSLELAGYGIAFPELATSLANSFLVVAGRVDRDVEAVLDEEDFAWVYATERALPFVKSTVLSGREAVVSRCERLSDAAPALESVVEQRLTDEPLRLGTSVWLTIARAVNTDGWSSESVAFVLQSFVDTLVNASEADGTVPASLLDFTPFNAVERNGVITSFDLEWRPKEAVHWSWALLRGVYFSLNMITSFAKPADEVAKALGPLAEQIVARCLGRYALGAVSLPDFMPWLLSIQAAASGRDLETIRELLTHQWDAPLRVRSPHQIETGSSYGPDDPLNPTLDAIYESLRRTDGKPGLTQERMEIVRALWTVRSVRSAEERDAQAAERQVRAAEREAHAAEVGSLNERIAALQTQLAASSTEVRQLQEVVAAIQESVSWKLTEPLREAMSLLRAYIRRSTP